MNELVTAYSPNIRRLARSVVRSHPSMAAMPFHEIEGCAVIGMWQAAQRWRPEFGVTFMAYAWPRMRGAVRDMQRDIDPHSRGVRKAINAIVEAEDRLSQSSEPFTHAEVLVESGLSPEVYLRAVTARRETRFDDLVWFTSPHENAPLYIEVTHPDESDDPACDAAWLLDLRDHVAGALGQLKPAERHVIIGQFIQGRTLKDLGADLGVTESRACQIRRSALERLRAMDVLRDLAAHVQGVDTSALSAT